METAALRALAIPEILSLVLEHAGGACACSYSSFQLVSKAWRDSARPIALSFAKLVLRPNGHELSCNDDWGSDHRARIHASNLADSPAIHRDIGRVSLSTIFYSQQINGHSVVKDAWDDIASCMRMHKLSLVLAQEGDLKGCHGKLPETLRELDIEFPSELLEQPQALVAFVPSLKRLRKLILFVADGWKRSGTVGTERGVNLVYFIKSVVSHLSYLDLVLPFCTNDEILAIVRALQPLSPNLRYFRLDAGGAFAKDIVHALPQGLHRLSIFCRTQVITSHLLEALQDRLYLPLLREIPDVSEPFGGTMYLDVDRMITTQHVDAAIAGLKQRKYLVFSKTAAARLYKLVDRSVEV